MRCSRKKIVFSLVLFLVVNIAFTFKWTYWIDKLWPARNFDDARNPMLRRNASTAADIPVLTQNPALVNPSTKFSTSQHSSTIPPCPQQPPKLVGQLKVDFYSPTIKETATANPDLRDGGYFEPNCKTEHKVAIIIPYRNRFEQLKMFLHHMHPILQRQQISYQIFVVEQLLRNRFNRALLMNIGYAEAIKLHDFNCFIFHDVDLLPENDYNLYTCPEEDAARHMSGYIDKYNYKLPYGAIFGGISALTKKQMIATNGFSNLFWGWGGEDDDMNARIRHRKFGIKRYPAAISHYKMFKHKHEAENKANPERFRLIKETSRRIEYDGINSLSYHLNETVVYPTHIVFRIIVDEEEVKKAVQNMRQLLHIT